MVLLEIGKRLRTGPLGAIAKTAIKRTDDLIAWLRSRTGVAPKPSVVFEVFNSFGFDAQSAVIRHLLSRGLVDVAVTSGKLTGNELAELCKVQGVAMAKLMPASRARHARPSVVVITDLREVGWWRTIRFAFLHHGSSHGNIPVPYAFYILQKGEAQYLLCLSDAEKLLGEKLFGGDFAARAVVTGPPKLDAMVNGKFDRSQFLGSLGLDARRPTILVNSHWTPTSLFRSCDLHALRRGIGGGGFNLLVMAHYHLFNAGSEKFSGRIDWLARLRSAFDGPNMRVLSRLPDNRPVLHAADMLVGDHSSVTLEYAVLRRPILLYRNPQHALSDSTMEGLLLDTAAVFQDPGRLPDLVQAHLGVPVDPQARTRLLGYCFAHLGESALRAARALESLAIFGRFRSDGEAGR